MKKNNMARLAALTSTLLLACSAVQAQTVQTQPGDLILGFRATGGTGSSTNLEVNLGSLTNFINLAPGTVINLTSRISLNDLSMTYSANWNSRTDLLWSVVGTSGNTGVGGLAVNTLFGTSVDTSGGFGTGVVYKRDTSGNQNTASGLIAGQQGALNGVAQAGTVFSGKKASTDGGSYSDSITNSGLAIVAFGNSSNSGWGSPGGSPFENNANLGGGPAKSDLYELVPVARTPTAGLDLGTFQLSSDGSFTFVAAAVPEPSTWAMVAIGGALLAACVRRRGQAARH
jgi:hypothetical protein